MNKKTPEEWGKIYRDRYSTYESFTQKLEDLIRELTNGLNIDLRIESRPKSVESFVKKIDRKPNKYKNPIEEITDLVALRIIAYYKEDVESIAHLIKEQFEVDPKKSVDKAELLDPDRFGYLSLQYICHLLEERESLPEWKSYGEIQFEIQIRTILQHAWAEVDHKLRYKNKVDVPKELQRKLFRLSALFEIADDEFSDLRKQIEEIEESYNKRVQKGELNFELNYSSLETYLDSTKIHFDWSAKAAEIGYKPCDRKKLSSHWRLQEVEHKHIIVKLFTDVGIKTIKELDEILQSASDWGEEVLTKIYELSNDLGYTPFANPYEILVFLIFYAKRDLVSDKVLDEANFFLEVNSALLTILGEGK